MGLPDAPPPPAQPEDRRAQQQAAEQGDQSLLSELLSSPEVLRGLMAHPFVPGRTDAGCLATSSLGGPPGQGMQEAQNSNLHNAGRGRPAPTSTANQQRYLRGHRNQLNCAQQPSKRPLHKPLHGTGSVARRLKRPTEKENRGRNINMDDDSDYLKALRAKKSRKDLPDVPNVEPRLLEMILNEVIDKSPGVECEDIAGLELAKKSITEAVIWPMLKPDIFTGLRGPPKGVLLFGPPGTGKVRIYQASLVLTFSAKNIAPCNHSCLPITYIFRVLRYRLASYRQ